MKKTAVIHALKLLKTRSSLLPASKALCAFTHTKMRPVKQL
ncbi:hypothetical protein [Cellvibrio sp. NN19]|nr:hypothetical protein [Cellvibrio sp. NN19]